MPSNVNCGLQVVMGGSEINVQCKYLTKARPDNKSPKVQRCPNHLGFAMRCTLWAPSRPAHLGVLCAVQVVSRKMAAAAAAAAARPDAQQVLRMGAATLPPITVHRLSPRYCCYDTAALPPQQQQVWSRTPIPGHPAAVAHPLSGAPFLRFGPRRPRSGWTRRPRLRQPPR